MADNTLKNGVYPARSNYLLYGGIAGGGPNVHGQYVLSEVKQKGNRVAGKIAFELGESTFTGTVDRKGVAHLTIKDGGIAPSIGFGRIVDAKVNLPLMDHESDFGSKLPQKSPYYPDDNVKSARECKMQPGAYPELTYFTTNGGGEVVRAKVEVVEVREVGIRPAGKGPFDSEKVLVEGKLKGPTIDGVADFTGQVSLHGNSCGAELDVDRSKVGPGTYNEPARDYSQWGGVNENVRLILSHREGQSPPPAHNPYFPEGKDPGQVSNPGLEGKK